MVPSVQINNEAAGSYLKLSGAASQAGKLNNDSVLTGRVKGVSKRLIAEVGAFRADAVGWQWEVNVFDSDQINAFCAPGGKIGVYSGIVRRLELTDDELAAVIGHEIAHALREHTREQVSQSRLAGAIVKGIANSGARNAGTTSALASIGSVLFVQLPFSREMESEADLIGLELMARAGFDPRLASSLWRKMRAQEGQPSGLEFFKTHPSNERRIEQIEAATPRVMAVYRGKADSNREAPNVPTVMQSNTAAVSPKSPVPLSTSLVSVTRPEASRPAPESSRSVEVLKGLLGGVDEYQVRQAAQSQACANPKPVLIEKGPGSEVYMVACDGGKELRYVCEFGNCSAR